eukprot:768543-Hanusia_phi.AAC.11
MIIVFIAISDPSLGRHGAQTCHDCFTVSPGTAMDRIPRVRSYDRTGDEAVKLSRRAGVDVKNSTWFRVWL